MKKLCQKKHLSNEEKQEIKELKEDLKFGLISATILGLGTLSLLIINSDLHNTAEVLNSVGIGCVTAFLGFAGGIVVKDSIINKSNDQKEEENKLEMENK